MTNGSVPTSTPESSRPTPGSSDWTIWFFVVSIFIFFFTFAVGLTLYPHIFWDQFLWKYFVGPIEADATGKTTDGISEGYNPVNTFCYGLILAGSVYWIFRYLDSKGIKVDERFALALIPYILLGSILRVLEDASYFSEPTRYLMISPLIYIIVGLFTILIVSVSIMFRDLVDTARTARDDRNIHYFLTLTWIIFLGTYGMVYFWYQDAFTHMEHPIFALFLIGIITHAIRWSLNRLSIEPSQGGAEDESRIYHIYLSSIGWFLSAIALYHLCWWGWHRADDLHLIVIPGILTLTVLAWYGTMMLVNWVNTKYRLTIGTKITGLNSMMILSQFLDGAATYTGLDHYGYREKHVLPSYLIDLTGTAAVMFVLKFMVLVLTLYLLDVEYKKEMEQYPRLCGLIKIVVIVLGMAPGTRDLLRLAVGT